MKKIKTSFSPTDFDPKPYVDEIYRQVEALDDKGVLEKKRYFQRLHEFVYPTTTSMKPPKYKVKTKGGVKGSRKEAAHEKSTKREPSHWEDDVMEGAYPSNGSQSKTKGSQSTRSKTKGSQCTASAAAACAAAH
ncbi:hypothetical protein RIF29_40768 [Crotalaria pallida]|uniref:Uncharacterized protein n=1 Tax=Crotalaria pallida TaxID=3830 RepID=A0AAN9E3T7_CROPI